MKLQRSGSPGRPQATATAPCQQLPWESPPPGRRNALLTGSLLWFLHSSAIRMGWMEIDHTEGERPTGGSQSTKGLRASVRPPRSCQAGEEVVLMGIFQGTLGSSKNGGLPHPGRQSVLWWGFPPLQGWGGFGGQGSQQ